MGAEVLYFAVFFSAHAFMVGPLDSVRACTRLCGVCNALLVGVMYFCAYADAGECKNERQMSVEK